jgi:hypothetical protein
MIYQDYNFSDGYSNASGSGREMMAISELAKLVREHPQAIKDTLISSNIEVNPNLSKKGLGSLIARNKQNREMIKKLSLLIVTNAKVNEGDDNFNDFLGKNKNKQATSGEKQGLFKKIGKFFKDRKARKQANKSTKSGGGLGSKIGGFLNKNQDQIASVGGSLFESLSNRGGGGGTNSLMTQIQGGGMPTNNTNNNNNNNNNNNQGMSMGMKIGIGVGVLALLGMGVYILRKNKRSGK